MSLVLTVRNYINSVHLFSLLAVHLDTVNYANMKNCSEKSNPKRKGFPLEGEEKGELMFLQMHIPQENNILLKPVKRMKVYFHLRNVFLCSLPSTILAFA